MARAIAKTAPVSVHVAVNVWLGEDSELCRNNLQVPGQKMKRGVTFNVICIVFFSMRDKKRARDSFIGLTLTTTNFTLNIHRIHEDSARKGTINCEGTGTASVLDCIV